MPKIKTVKLFETTNLLALFLTLMGLYMIYIIRYLQLTSSSAADEVELLTLLLATHVYWPASDRWTPVIVKLWLLLALDAVSRESPLMFNRFPSFVHVTLGDGFPLTSQLKETFCPSSVVRPLGCQEISGATEKNNKNMFRQSYQCECNHEFTIQVIFKEIIYFTMKPW